MDENQSYIHNPVQDSYIYKILPDLLEQQANECPNVEAFVFCHPKGQGPEREAITFRALQNGSTNLAAYFLKLGMKPKDCIMVVGPTCPEWIFVENALMKIGVLVMRLKLEMANKSAMCHLLKKYTVRGVIYHSDGIDIPIIIEATRDQCQIDFVISMKELHTIFHNEEVTKENITDVKAIQNYIKPEDPVYVYFTSGSTGFPKAVVISHMCIINEQHQYPGMEWKGHGQMRVFCDRPPAWVGFLNSLSLICGITMVYVDTKYTTRDKNTKFVFNVLHDEDINGAILIPYILTDLLEAMEKGPYQWPASLTWAMTGGDMVPEALFRKALKYIPRLTNCYGSTEGSTIIHTDHTDSDEMKSQVIGRPVAHSEVKITDERGDIIRRGEVGELQVRSMYLFTEYLNDPTATADVKDPITGWYNTRDLAKMTTDGHVSILGRMSSAISRAGAKVFPVVIEQEILSHSKVSKVAVIGVPDERLYEEICACVIPVKESKVSAEELKEFCESNMKTSDGLGHIPKYFIMMNSFPLADNGKTDRKALLKIAQTNLGLEK